MPTTILTAPTVEPVSLAEAKLHCRVDTTDENTLLSALIVAAREYVEQVTGRALITRTYRAMEYATGAAFELLYPPFRTLDSVETCDIYGDLIAGSAVIGSGANGAVTVSIDGAAANSHTVQVIVSTAVGLSLSAAEVGGAIAVTLGTDGTGALDATKNTATKVAAVLSALDGITATASGTGATALSAAEGPTDLTGGAGTLTTVDEDDYTLDRLRQVPTLTVSSVADDAEAVRVVYTAGYGDAATDVPQAIRQAILLLVGAWYGQRESISPETVREVPFAVTALLSAYGMEFWGMGTGR